MNFYNRQHAGRLLAEKLESFKFQNPIILALPRGGVPVAAEVATVLDAPLEVLAVRKIGAPFQPEVAVGALCEDEKPLWRQKLLSNLELKPEDLENSVNAEIEKVRQQIKLFRQGRSLASVKGRTVIVVDDGLATGATMWAAISFLQHHDAKKIVVAAPVSATSAAEKFRSSGTQVVATFETEDLNSVGEWYEDFSQVSNEEVIQILKEHKHLDNAKHTKNWNQETVSLDAAIKMAMVPVTNEIDYFQLIQSIKDARIVMLGEASHGTHEFYQVRRFISQQLIKNHGFKFIAVEGDWPDADRLNKYIKSGVGGSAHKTLMHNHRWPTWMWANDEIVKLAEWMRSHHAGFYGLDIYSMFESIQEVINFVEIENPILAKEVKERYACFDHFQQDEVAYARSLVEYPAGCEAQVLKNLDRILKLRLENISQGQEALFSSQQNARVIANAENYYRAMMKGDATSWNVRDEHMLEVLEQLLEKHGKDSKGIVWAHNTHIGDYRATDMNETGYINLGGLVRQSYGEQNVALVGFGTYQGQVLAGSSWGRPEQIMILPPAREGSYEHRFHHVLKAEKNNLNQVYVLLDDKSHTAFAQRLGHRAVGVVYDPKQEYRGNYVPTELSKRYDAFVFIDQTKALKSLHAISVFGEIPETWPSGQ